MENTCILDIENVSKSFGKKKIIDNISLKVNTGEVFGFLGPNGAGKTTTIKMIMGLLSIDSGKILINGFNVSKDFEKAMMYIGGIVENPDMYGYLSGYQNLKLHARIYGVGNDRINEVVKLVSLEKRIKDKVSKYSLGMKQRLGLALALLHNPKVLILDEPTNGLDPSGIKDLRDILKDLAHNHGICVFVSSHLLSEMQLMCDKVAVIDSGKIIKVETLENVLNNKTEENESIYDFEVIQLEQAKKVIDEQGKYKYSIDTEKNIISIAIEKENVSEIVKLFVKNNIDIEQFQKQKKSLEEAFINMTGGSKK